MNEKLTIFFAVTVFLCLGVSVVEAAEGGYSNYVPGTYGDFGAAMEPPTKWTVKNDYYHYQADGGSSVRSGQLTLDTDLEMNIHFLTMLYKTDQEFLGGRYALGAFIPTVVNIDSDTDITVAGSPVTFQEEVTRFGDVAFVPGVLYWKKDNFHFSVAEYIVAPTGDYDKDNLVNTSLNYWTFDTNFAATYLDLEKGQDYSINIGYNYNTENSDTDYQTGQEIHLDYMVNQFLSESFAVGVHGFYLKQITGDSGKGAILGSYKSDAAGIGPALLWSPKKFNGSISFIAKWLHEFHAENRLEGDHIFLSLVASF
jgi:hypothetical protein